MELIIFVGALCIVGVLANHFGHDSRPPAPSKEQDLANLGLSWRSSDPPGENTLTRHDVRHAPARWRSWIRTIAAARHFREESAR